MSDEKTPHQPFPLDDEDGAAQPASSSYSMVDPRFRQAYFHFYKETYKPSALDRKTKEGHLLRREDVEQAWGGAVNITRTRLLGVASTARQRIPHLETEEVELITTLIRQALEELAAGELKE